MRYEVPELMRHRATALGERGTKWLSELGVLLDMMAEQWQLCIGEQMSGGTEALVFAVSQNKQPAVLKLGLPNSLAAEALTFELSAGAGYAKRLRFDRSRDALLLEQLGAQLAADKLSANEQIKIICDTLALGWQQITDSTGLKTCADVASTQAMYIRENWEALDRPCPIRLIDRALSYTKNRELAFDPKSSYLLHGDAHIWNTLEAPDSPTGYKFVDPDGVFGERALDLAISLREWREELLENDALTAGQLRCELLSNLAGVDYQAIWEWGLIEHTSCGLLDLKLGDHSAALDHFKIATRWLDA